MISILGAPPVPSQARNIALSIANTVICLKQISPHLTGNEAQTLARADLSRSERPPRGQLDENPLRGCGLSDDSVAA
ncbi:MAG TPA: hypothetical protein VNV38_10640 [Stellaceae bacterium]|jgi:hypothetical protein|nr:hypothetical protein [Stellaceae bacterium]